MSCVEKQAGHTRRFYSAVRHRGRVEEEQLCDGVVSCLFHGMLFFYLKTSNRQTGYS